MRKSVCSIALALLLASGTAALAQQFDPKAYDQMIDANSPDTIPPGTKITVHNWTQYKRLMMVWMQVAFSGKKHFYIADSPDYTMEVQPTGNYTIPAEALRDTQKYAG